MAVSTMEPPPPFRLPREAHALKPLSPERVNGIRPLSALSTTATKTSKTSEADTQSQYPDISSTHSSPTRKANLFNDYHPSNGTPTKTSGFALPQSPSLPEIHALRSHVRTNSDVQGLVKRFEHLDVRDRDAESAERRKKHEAELGRAQIAREEAESDAKRLREELRRMKKESDEGRERERRVAKRLEHVMEEYAGSKESHTAQSGIYEKELRRARKEAFKSSSAVLKLQEELKSTRNTLRITQSGYELEKQKVQRREQETFSAQYQLVAVQEELDKLQSHLRTVEEEKEALKTSLKEEEVARMAAEGMIALPAAREDDEDDLSGSPSKRRSPQKTPASPLSDDKENIGVVSKKMLQMKDLEAQLWREAMRREHAEEMVEFLSLECTFRCCKCRSAKRPTHDISSLAISHELAAAIDELREGMVSVLLPSKDAHDDEKMQLDTESEAQQARAEAEPIQEMDVETGIAAGQELTTSEATTTDEQDRSMTMTAEEPVAQAVTDPTALETHDVDEQEEPPASSAETEDDSPEDQQNEPTSPPPSDPQTPSFNRKNPPNSAIRTITTTTTIPMQFTPVTKPHMLQSARFIPDNTENIPPPPQFSDGNAPTFDRAAALAAIEYRRGRAKSIANGQMTPRKQMLEGVNVKERRDISAPALGGKANGGGVGSGMGMGVGSVGRAGGRGVMF